MCAGTAAVDRRMSGARAAVVAESRTAAGKAGTRLGFRIRDWGFASPAARCPTNPKSRIRPTNPKSRIPNPESVAGRLAYGLQDVVRLREDGFFEVRAIRHRTVEGADALDGRVEMLEQLAGNPRGQLGAEAAHHLILICDDDTIGALDVRGDRVPVVRHDRPQVEHRDAEMILLRLLAGQDRSLHERAPRDDEDVIAFAAQARLAERDHEVFAGVLTFVVRLPVEVLVLEEQHRVVAANRRAQQAGRIDRVRRVHDANARAVREDALARLAVIRAAAAE